MPITRFDLGLCAMAVFAGNVLYWGTAYVVAWLGGAF